MHNIYTSYFANWRNFPKNSVQVSVALYPPRTFKGETYKPLCPPKTLLNDYKNKVINEFEYTDKFNEYLDNFESYKIFRDLEKICGDKDCILLCYEKPNDFCHRHIIADWFIKNGVYVEELKK